MKPSIIEAYKKTVEYHEYMHLFLTSLHENIVTEHDMESATDIAYGLQKILQMVKDTEKDTRIRQQLAEKMACVLWVKDGGEKSNIKTDYVTGTPDVKMIASIPRRDKEPDAFFALMDHFGLPRDLFPGEDADVVRPHWPGVVAALSKEMSEGKPLPNGIDPNKTYPKYELRLHGKKGVDE
jgi:hypothetical protein